MDCIICMMKGTEHDSCGGSTQPEGAIVSLEGYSLCETHAEEYLRVADDRELLGFILESCFDEDGEEDD